MELKQTIVPPQEVPIEQHGLRLYPKVTKFFAWFFILTLLGLGANIYYIETQIDKQTNDLSVATTKLNDDQQHDFFGSYRWLAEMRSRFSLHLISPHHPGGYCIGDTMDIAWEGNSSLIGPVTVTMRSGDPISGPLYQIGVFPLTYNDANVKWKGEFKWTIGSTEGPTDRVHAEGEVGRLAALTYGQNDMRNLPLGETYSLQLNAGMRDDNKAATLYLDDSVGGFTFRDCSVPDPTVRRQ